MAETFYDSQYTSSIKSVLVRDVYWQNSIAVPIKTQDQCDEHEETTHFCSRDENSGITSDSDSSCSTDIKYYTCSLRKNKIKRYNGSKVTETTALLSEYNPYLERYRLRLNNRQKERMKQLNSTYGVLNEILPTEIRLQKVKNNSKLGILRRAILYWKYLEKLLE